MAGTIPVSAAWIRLLGCFVLFAAVSSGPGQEPSPEALLRSAVAAARNGPIGRAEPLFRVALQAAKSRSGRDDLGVSNVLHEYGLALRLANQPARAAEALEHALAIREKELPGDHAWIGFTAAQLAWAYFAVQRYDDALVVNGQAIGVMEQHRAPRQTLLASQLGLQGRILSAQENYSAAASRFERAIGVLQNDTPADTRLISQFQWFLGGVSERLNDAAAMKSAYENALDLDQKTPALSDVQRADAEYAIGARESAAGELPAALEWLQRALAHYDKTARNNPKFETSVCVEIAQIHHELRSYPEAETMYLRALAVLAANAAEGTQSLASISTALAMVYRAQGKIAEAERLQSSK